MQFYWAAWILVGFGVPEAWALTTGHPERTLSDTVWHWFDVTPGPTPLYGRIGVYLLIVVLVFLLGHLAFGLWRKW